MTNEEIEILEVDVNNYKEVSPEAMQRIFKQAKAYNDQKALLDRALPYLKIFPDKDSVLSDLESLIKDVEKIKDNNAETFTS